MKIERIRSILKRKELKITPQRVFVFEALIELGDHPTADNIIEIIKINHPNIAVGTVYKTLETFVETGMVKKVKTDKDVMRYDPILSNHHHLYSVQSERIEDYYDDKLNTILEKYFKKKQLDNFEIEDIKLQINGRFID